MGLRPHSFNRLESEVYAQHTLKSVSGRKIIPQVGDEASSVMPKNENISDRILKFCSEAKGMQEIMEHLRYRDRKTVRKYLKPLVL